MTRPQTSVSRGAYRARLDPLRVEAEHPVGVTVLGRSRVLQRGELERDHVVPIGQAQGVGFRDRGAEHRAAVAHRLQAVAAAKPGDRHFGNVRIVANGPGAEVVEAVDPAEEQLAAPASERRAGVEFVALESVVLVEVPEGPGLGIEPGEAPVGAEPEVAGVVGLDRVDDVVRQTIAFGEVLEVSVVLRSSRLRPPPAVPIQRKRPGRSGSGRIARMASWLRLVGFAGSVR